MSKLAEDDLEQSALRLWAGRVGILVLAVGVLAGLVWLIVHLDTPTRPNRQVAKISMLPDTPPPPPPPKEEKKPEPPKEESKTVQVEQPKPEQAPDPEPAQLKMEGAAGDGPSAFASGDVKTEYKGGEIGTNVNARARFAAYTTRLERVLQQELARRSLRGSVKVYLWLAPDGSVQRFKLIARDGTEDADPALRAAFAELRGVGEAPPADMPMPAGLQISMQ